MTPLACILSLSLSLHYNMSLALSAALTEGRRGTVRCDSFAALNHAMFSGFHALYPTISGFQHLALKVRYLSYSRVQRRSPAIAAAIAGYSC